ncbi:hypothetical protein [Subtercola endophyticus]|uniref:hypothetical protein n=1 Tax=Subtercola endophyticus TaxID=2895559 RepID=UPI001E29C6A2|nr:hypothetical protein [Subtercola endophyticus]UFS59933.1 hypothetical protein LQ955_03880 [Subtercola endophyticus]
MKRAPRKSSAAVADIAVEKSADEVVEWVTELLAGSVWDPGAKLEVETLAALLKRAATVAKSPGSGGLRHVEAEAIVDELDLALSGTMQNLAVNTLVLLSQVRHGIEIGQMRPEHLIPLYDGLEGCWGLISVDRFRVDVRVRTEDVNRLEEATERLLGALEIVPDEAKSVQRALNTAHIAIVLMDHAAHPAREVSRDGGPSREGVVHVLGRLGRVGYMLRRPLPLALGLTALALLLVSLGIQLFEVLTLPAAGPVVVTAEESWRVWLHSLVDKLLTTSLWAFVLAFAEQVRRMGRHPRSGSERKRVLITWGR